MRTMTRAVLTAAAAGLLLCDAAGVACADDDSPPPTESRGTAVSLLDNSHSDSILEMDRMLNSQVGSGTAGSDHDGNEANTTVPKEHCGCPT